MAKLEELDAYWRLYEFTTGRVLSDADVADIQQVLNDYNDEIGSQVEHYSNARDQVLREIGGEELLQAANKADTAQGKLACERALKHYYAKAAEAEAALAKMNN